LVVLLIAAQMESQLQDAGLAVLIADEAYLRPSEVLSLGSENLVEPQASGGLGYQHFNLVIRARELMQPTKIGAFDDAVRLDRPVPGNDWKMLLHPLLHRRRGLGTLWTFKHKDFVACWKQAVEAIGVQHYDKPYLLRHSGPSQDRSANWRSLEEVQQRGRWSTRSSMTRYEKHSRLQHGWARLPVEVRDLATVVQGQLGEFLKYPDRFDRAKLVICGNSKSTASVKRRSAIFNA
jgi:hypothetical protein